MIVKYRGLKEKGKLSEAKELKTCITKIKYAREHFIYMANLDFEKPTKSMMDLADAMKIDMKEPRVLAEFKAIQLQDLDEIRRFKEGKAPSTKEEVRQERNKYVKKLLETYSPTENSSIIA